MKLEAENHFDAVAELEEYQTRGDPVRERPPMLPPSAIKTAPLVFQPRQFWEGFVDEQHVSELRRSLKAQEGAALAPVLVMQIGADAVCVDGHHRLAAYTALGITSPIPVEWFEGTIREGVREAVQRNSQDKLAMTRASKLEAAWRMVVLKEGSKAAISRATTIPASTVANMRKKHKEITEAEQRKGVAAGLPSSDQAASDFVCRLTWAEAKRYGQGSSERDDAWEEAIIADWARKLGKTFGSKWPELPQLAARAIERYSERLPEKLIEVWKDDLFYDDNDEF